MPYKSKADAKEQKRKWRAQNKDKELVYRKRHAKRKLARAHERCDEIRKRRIETFGEVCFLCGEKNFAGSPNIGYILHEIHGRPHTGSSSESELRYPLEHKEDFIPLCINDHKMVHRMMKLLGLSWNDIFAFTKRASRTPNAVFPLVKR